MIGRQPSKEGGKPFQKKLSHPPLLKATEEPQEVKSEELPPGDETGG